MSESGLNKLSIKGLLSQLINTIQDYFGGKLTNRLLKLLTLNIFITFLVIEVMLYFYLAHLMTASSFHDLQLYNYQRSLHESISFNGAKNNHSAIIEYIQNNFYKNPPVPNTIKLKKFDDRLEKLPDGTTRNRKKNFDGTKMAGVFIPKNVNLTPERKMEIVFLIETVEFFGPAYHHQFQDTYFTTPDNIMVIYWPEVPLWTLEMASDFDMTKEEYVWVADQKHNPKRHSQWTGLFYDSVGKIWMTSLETPMDLHSTPVLTLGHDLMLADLIQRVNSKELEGTTNLVLRDDGRLIAFKEKLEEIKAKNGLYLVSEHDKNLFPIYQLLQIQLKKSANKFPISTYLHSINSYVSISPISDHGWYFITLLPRDFIIAKVISVMELVAIFFFLLLVLQFLFFVKLLKNRIHLPLAQLIKATDILKFGNYQHRVMEARYTNANDELGILAKNFNDMARNLDDRDFELLTNNANLENMIEQRTKELDRERLQSMHHSKLATLGEMASTISHEINNPLTVLGGKANQLRRELSSEAPDVKKCLVMTEKIDQMTERITKIIKGLKFYSRYDDELSFQKNSIHEILLETVNLCSYKLSKLEIELTIPESDPYGKTIDCLDVQISQVLLNLISNAADAIESYEPKLEEKWIKVQYDQHQTFPSFHKKFVNDQISEDSRTWLEIKVIDSGSGLTKEKSELIFKSFYTTKEKGKGTGLGLSISKNIIELHHGYFFVDYTKKNTTFIMLIPFQQQILLPKKVA